MPDNEAARILAQMEISAQLSEGELEMPELDGTAKHTDFLTPFDAHDRVLRQTDWPAYEHQEFPKAVDHVQKTDAPEGHMEPGRILVDGEE